MTIRFDDAWFGARGLALQISDEGNDVVLVRDILGRISLILESSDIESAEKRLRDVAGPFAAQVPTRAASDLFLPDAVLKSPNLVIERERAGTRGRLAVLENRIVGTSWTLSAEHRPPPHRVTMYAFKGGVGRSTASVMLAKHLAESGRCVLVVDLDLESPGIGALTQRDDDLSDHGVVDHLVEDVVDNANELNLVSRSRLITGELNGEIWIAPAAGRPRPGYDYLAKLNRIYTDLPVTPDGRTRRFGDRLEAAVSACEAEVTSRSRRPDVVLLDSRAGIHDVAAVALTQLGDLNLLFGSDNPQTWRGYRALFEQWRVLPHRRELASRLRMVASMVPANDEAAYLSSFRDHAQECFAETLYEEASPDDVDAFNYDVEDPDAPHSPLRILFHGDLVSLDPTRSPDWHSQLFVQASFNRFLESAVHLIGEEST
jgi:AAA domain-containing protein